MECAWYEIRITDEGGRAELAIKIADGEYSAPLAYGEYASVERRMYEVIGPGMIHVVASSNKSKTLTIFAANEDLEYLGLSIGVGTGKLRINPYSD